MGKPAILNMPKPLNSNEIELLTAEMEHISLIRRIYSQDIFIKHQKSDLQIIVKADKLRSQHFGQYQFVEGIARITNHLYDVNHTIEIPCQIACGKLYKLKEHLSNKQEVNLFDHLDLLLPIWESVGLFTYQNGIQNSKEDFKKMGKSIIEKFSQEGVFPLCIGIYNATSGMIYGLGTDYKRLWDEWNNNPYSILVLRQMAYTLSKILPKIKPGKVLWAHIAHSEGGLIASEVFSRQTYLSSQYDYQLESFIRDHVVTLTFGGVAAVPNIVKEAINTYSRDDVTVRYIKKYLDKDFLPADYEDEAIRNRALDLKTKNHFYKSHTVDQIFNEQKAMINFDSYICSYPHTSKKDGHTVTIVESLVPKLKQDWVSYDHSFLGDTYQMALLKNIIILNETYKIYDCR